MKANKKIWFAVTMLSVFALSSCNLGGGQTAPTPDLGAAQTQAFGFVLTQSALQQTQTAMAVPPATNTPIPTNTQSGPPTFAPVGGSVATPFGINTQTSLFTPIALPSLIPTAGSSGGLLPTQNGCNNSTLTGEYYHEVTWLHKPLEVNIGETVEQFFTHLNTGTCIWDEGYAFVPQPAYTTMVNANTIVIAKNKPEDYTPPNTSKSFKGIAGAPKVAGPAQACWKLRDDAGNFFGEISCLFVLVRKP